MGVAPPPSRCALSSQLLPLTRSRPPPQGCSSLRKTHLLYLAREWGYQSDLWCKREARRAHNLKMDRQRAQKAAAEAAAAAAAAAAGLLGAGGGGDEPGAAAYIPVPSLAPPLVQPPPAPPRSGTPTPGGGTKRTAAAAGLYPSGAAWADGGVPPPSSLPSLMWPRKGAERSTAGGIAAWAADVCRGPLASGAAALGAAASGSSADDDSSQPLAAIAAHATLALRPLAEESVRLFGGEAPPDVAGAHHHGAVAAAAVWLADIAADTFSALASLRARAATLPASTASSVAWLQLLGRACPLEDCMLRLQHGLHCATLDVTRPGPGPALQRWPGDMVRGALTALELVARCQSLTTQSKARAARVWHAVVALPHALLDPPSSPQFVSYGAYVKITLALKELMANYTHAAATALQARADAMAALLEEHGQHGGEGETAQGGGGGGGGGDHGGGPGGGNGGAEPAGNGHGGGGGGGGAEEGGDAHGGASLSPGGLGLTLNLGGLPGFGGVPPLPTGGAPPPPLAPLRGVPPIWSGPILVMAGNGAGGGLRLPPIVSRALDEDEVQGARAAAAAAEALPAQSDASGMGPQQRR